jgi:signal transduction histidine kinase
MGAVVARFWNQMSLQTWFLFQAGLIFSILFFVFIYLSFDALRSNTDELLAGRRLIAEQIASHIDLLLEQSFNQAQRCAPSSDNWNDLKVLAGIGQLCWELPLSPVYAILTNTAESRPKLNNTGASFASDLPEQVKELSVRGRKTTTNIFPADNGHSAAYYLVAPASGARDTQDPGIVLGVDPTNSNLSSFLNPAGLGLTGAIEVVDSSGLVLASTRKDGILLKADHGDQYARMIAGSVATVGVCHSCHQAGSGEQRGQEILAFAPLRNAPWGVAIRQSEDEALAGPKAIQWRLFYLGLASLCGVVLVAWRAFGRLSQSTKQLEKRAGLMALGDLESPMPAASGSEMVRLAKSLDDTRRGLLVAWKDLETANRELERRLEARTVELGSVVKISESLVSNGGPETLLSFIVQVASQALRADAAAVFLWDEQRGALVAKASTGYDRQALAQVALLPGEGIVGKVYKDGHAAMSNHSAEVIRLLSDLSPENRRYLLWARGGQEPTSFICVPMESRQQLLGSFFLAGLHDPISFSASNIELARTYARIGSALQQNLRLVHETSQAEALRRADQIKTEFFSNTSHELQTPLASLRASLELLPQAFSKADTEALITLIENAQRSAERLQRLVADLIDVARLHNLHLKLETDVIDLLEVVEQSIAKFTPIAEKKNQVLKYFEGNAPNLVVGDQRRIEQVLGNLLMNAYQYTPEGGHITVSLHDAGEEYIISVADTGPGIRPQDKLRLFERFYRGNTDKGTSGLGLGLAIAKGLIELHGGRIWVESGQAQGSIFSFSLPKAVLDENLDR